MDDSATNAQGTPAPASFYCPITKELMTQPVIARDGHTYDKKAIRNWFATGHAISPMTGLRLFDLCLVPNHALRNAIEEWRSGSAVPALVAGPPPATPPEPSPSTPVFKDADCAVTAFSVSPEVSCIRINPPDAPEAGKRGPTAMIAIIDTSGSMAASAVGAEMQEAGAPAITCLQLVQHSLRAIIECLGQDDVLALVGFSSRARIVLEPTLMTKTGKMKANNAITSLDADGGTNIWDGLRCGLDLVRTHDLMKGRHAVSLLLTDGQPAIEPPRGTRSTLQDYLATNDVPCTLHTFGYGYDSASSLLLDIARMGRGAFAFIPDCSLVGSVFVNWTAYVLAAATSKAAAQYANVPRSLLPGIIQYGQPVDVFVPAAALKPSVEAEASGATLLLLSDPPADAKITDVRHRFITRLEKALTLTVNESIASALHCVKWLYKQLQEDADPDLRGNEFVQGVIRDLWSNEDHEGQIGKAVAKEEWFNKWGKHYLRSSLSFHTLQYCGNFKDKSLAVFGGSLFKTVQTIAETAFLSLPPPEAPPVRRYTAYPAARGGAGPQHPHAAPLAPGSAAPAAAPMDMRAMYDRYGGCVSADTQFLTDDGQTYVRACDITPGATVMTPTGPASVVCVVEHVISGVSHLITLTDAAGEQGNAHPGVLRITPWHPVRMPLRSSPVDTTDNKGVADWSFPQDIASQAPHSTPASHPRAVEQGEEVVVYNFILSRGHVLLAAGGIHVCCLGHGIYDNAVIAHPFFASMERVTSALAASPGWNAGRVRVKASAVVRDEQTCMVTGYDAITTAATSGKLAVSSGVSVNALRSISEY